MSKAKGDTSGRSPKTSSKHSPTSINHSPPRRRPPPLLAKHRFLIHLRATIEASLARSLSQSPPNPRLKIIGDKTPMHTLAVAPLHQLFPKAKFIHIIRDPRDATISQWLFWGQRQRPTPVRRVRRILHHQGLASQCRIRPQSRQRTRRSLHRSSIRRPPRRHCFPTHPPRQLPRCRHKHRVHRIMPRQRQLQSKRRRQRTRNRHRHRTTLPKRNRRRLEKPHPPRPRRKVLPPNQRPHEIL